MEGMQAYGPPSMQEIKVNEYSVQLHAAHPVGCSLTAPCKKLLSHSWAARNQAAEW